MIKMKMDTSFPGPGTHSYRAVAALSPTGPAGLPTEAGSDLPCQPGVNGHNLIGKQTGKMHKLRASKNVDDFPPNNYT